MKSFFTAKESDAARGLRIIHFLIAFLILSGMFYLALARLAYYHWNWEAVWQYRLRFVTGWGMTLLVSGFSLICSLLIGLITAIGQKSSFLPLRSFCRLYVELIRGTPLLVQILLLYYGVFEAAGLRHSILAGILILSIFSGAYISEMIRAGIESIGKSQLETARAVGFNRWQTYRFVIFPQALRQTLPPLAGQFASLIKDSSLLMIIAVNEFTLAARDVSSLTYTAFESYLPLAVGYLILTLPIFGISRFLEKRMRFET